MCLEALSPDGVVWKYCGSFDRHPREVPSSCSPQDLGFLVLMRGLLKK